VSWTCEFDSRQELDAIFFTEFVGDLRGQLVEDQFVIPIRLPDKNLQTLPIVTVTQSWFASGKTRKSTRCFFVPCPTKALAYNPVLYVAETL